MDEHALVARLVILPNSDTKCFTCVRVLLGLWVRIHVHVLGKFRELKSMQDVDILRDGCYPIRTEFGLFLA